MNGFFPEAMTATEEVPFGILNFGDCDLFEFWYLEFVILIGSAPGITQLYGAYGSPPNWHSFCRYHLISALPQVNPPPKTGIHIRSPD